MELFFKLDFRIDKIGVIPLPAAKATKLLPSLRG